MAEEKIRIHSDGRWILAARSGIESGPNLRSNLPWTFTPAEKIGWTYLNATAQVTFRVREDREIQELRATLFMAVDRIGTALGQGLIVQ